MQKPKRQIRSPRCLKRAGAWLLSWNELIDACKGADVLEFQGIQVGAKRLVTLVRAMQGGYEVKIRLNGRLELETGDRPIKGYDPETHRPVYGRGRVSFYNFVSIVPGAWVPETVRIVAVLRPRLLRRKRG